MFSRRPLSLFRYALALFVLASPFFIYTIKIPKKRMIEAIHKKLPLVKKSSIGSVRVSSLEKISFSKEATKLVFSGVIHPEKKFIDEKMESTGNFFKKHKGIKKFVQDLKLDRSASLFKKKVDIATSKDYPFRFYAIVHPEYKGSDLFVLRILKVKVIDGPEILKKSSSVLSMIKEVRFHVEKLKKFSWIVNIYKIGFSKNGDILVSLGVSYFLVSMMLFLLFLREIGIIAIRVYQEAVSPHKGYRCAKAALHNESSCSGETLKAFKEKGFFHGIKTYFASTAKCKAAAKEIKNRKGAKSDNNVGCCDLGAASSGACIDGCGGTGDCGAAACDIGACSF